MPRGVDDRTQVQLVTLKTEAQLLKTWMARRDDVAQRRREGPITALKHRLGLLQREVPRLELEVAALERELSKGRAPAGVLTFAWALLKGALVPLLLLAWVVGVVTLTPNARADDPVRLASMLGLVVVFALSRAGSRKS